MLLYTVLCFSCRQKRTWTLDAGGRQAEAGGRELSRDPYADFGESSGVEIRGSDSVGFRILPAPPPRRFSMSVPELATILLAGSILAGSSKSSEPQQSDVESLLRSRLAQFHTLLVEHAVPYDPQAPAIDAQEATADAALWVLGQIQRIIDPGRGENSDAQIGIFLAFTFLLLVAYRGLDTRQRS